MIISGDNLRLHYWAAGRPYGGPVNLPEIEKEEYGYELLPGQCIYSARYDGLGINREAYFDAIVVAVDKEGVLLETHKGKKLLLWEKEFRNSKGMIEVCKLYIEPCSCLYEKNKLEDILNGQIDTETVENGKVDLSLGKGIWYQHGGYRTSSKYEENLRYFIKLGQMSMFN